MKKYTTALLVAPALALAFGSVALAHIAGATTTATTSHMENGRAQEAREKMMEKREDRMENREERMEKREERMENKEERMASTTAQREEKRDAKILAYTEKMVERLTAALDRIDRLTERVSSRIAKFSASGANTVKASQLLVVAKEKAVKARAEVAKVMPAVIVALAGDTPKESFKDAREVIKTAVEAIKSAHAALVDVIEELKGKKSDKATTTPKTATTSTTTQSN